MKDKTRRLTLRIWLLGIVLAVSIVSILVGDGYLKLLVFLLLIGTLYVINGSKSSTRAIILALIFVGIVVYLILNSGLTGVEVVSIGENESLFDQGLREGDTITSINGQEVLDIVSYSAIMSEIFSESGGKRLDVQTSRGEVIAFVEERPEVIVSSLKRTNIETGLDLRGGARALVKPDAPEITDTQLEELIAVSRNRFNVFGLTDVDIRGVNDLEGNKFMLIEIAGATPDDLEELVGQQGKFEAKVGNETVFIGGDRDISDVCRNDASCAGVTNCFAQPGGYACTFAFTIYLTGEAADRHADVTREIPLDPSGQYLTEQLFLFVDDVEVDALNIGASLKGQSTTQIQISGSSTGGNQQEAFENTQEEMNRLQTILITGSLPYKLEIVKLDTISPTLGGEFVRLILTAGISAILVTSLIVFVRYRKLKASAAMLFTAFSEIFIILGVASLINWNLDLPSIAGILAAIGTGVDQQIVILDEAGKSKEMGLRERMKRALFIISSAYATTFVALLPLGWAGAGLFRGFAFTTIIGITAGVLITRPAFADIIRKLEA